MSFQRHLQSAPQSDAGFPHTWTSGYDCELSTLQSVGFVIDVAQTPCDPADSTFSLHDAGHAFQCFVGGSPNRNPWRIAG